MSKFPEMQAPQRHKLLERHSQNMSDLQHLAVQENTVHQRIHNLRNRIEALLWIAAALSTAYYGNGESDMLFVVMNDSKIKRPWLYFGLLMLSMNLGIFLYLAVWLDCIKGNTEEWEDAAPYAIPVGTCMGLTAGFAFIVALWPVWSFLTPGIMVSLLMPLPALVLINFAGCSNGIHAVISRTACSFLELNFVLFMGFIMSFHFWPSFGRKASKELPPPTRLRAVSKTL